MVPEDWGSAMGDAPGGRTWRLTAGAHERAYILLVEDEEAVRRLTERALQRAGWQVSAVESAEAALEMLPRPGDSDRSALRCWCPTSCCPGMDGTELVRAVRAIWPDLPAVLVSGYTDSALLGDLAAQGVAFLAKPFRLRELVACVERAAAAGNWMGKASGGGRRGRARSKA